MPRIVVETSIQAPMADVFDAARNVDLHVNTMSHSSERVVGGQPSGLLELGDEVEFEGVHFGLRWRHRARITAFESPHRFVDTMVKGAFRSFVHEHRFEAEGSSTCMTDTVDFEAPGGLLGRLVERAFLRTYVHQMIDDRAQALRRIVEAPQ